MDRKESVELLKRKSNEAVYIASLKHQNNEYLPWRRNIEDILESTFGENSTEYKRVHDLETVINPYQWHDPQRAYVKLIQRIQQEIDSIIQKYETLDVKAEPTPTAKENSEQGVMMNKVQPAAFIAHGGKSGALDKLCDFLTNLGVQPLVVEELPTEGMLVDDKVKKYQREADCAIILATGGGIIEEKTGKRHPRLNVIDELARLRVVFPKKTILLLEQKIELPSNVSGIVFERFTRQSMDRAFIAIARELTKFGILKAVKPQKEE